MADAVDHFNTLLQEAAALNGVERFRDAIDRAKNAASLNPSDPRPYCEWSRALNGLEKYDEASEMARRATQMAPNDAWGFRLLSNSNTKLAKGRSKSERDKLGHEAVVAAKEAVRLTPYDTNAFVCLAQAHTLMKQTDEADAAIQNAIRLNPHSAAIWVSASYVAIGARNWSAAETASRNALAIEPGNYAALNNLGVALNNSGRKREGTEAIANAARVRPNSTTARTNLSRSGLNIARITVMIILLPVGLISNLGFSLYFIFSIISLIFISRNPKLVLRMERWAAPVALFFLRQPKTTSGPEGDTKSTARPATVRSSGTVDNSWSALKSRHLVRTSIVIFFAVVAGLISLFFLTFVFIVQSNARGAVVISALLFGLATFLLARSVKKRQRER